jgi:hypothetical protein
MRRRPALLVLGAAAILWPRQRQVCSSVLPNRNERKRRKATAHSGQQFTPSSALALLQPPIARRFAAKALAKGLAVPAPR